MPQASDELRAEWKDDNTAIVFLRQAGYTLQRDWSWNTKLNHAPTDKERRAAQYLIDEWDFGGINPPKPQAD